MDWITTSPLIILISILLVSLIESFALIGIVVPGVVLLFSLSAIANSISIPIWFVLMYASLGAAAGDLTSYFIGYKFKDRLHQLHWFQKHHNLVTQGTWFIQKWGWLSIIVGRFLGPLRPIVPILTGTLGMAPSRFIPLSLMTTLVWAPAYLLPGYYTGELADLWALQPLSNRSLMIYALTMISIAGCVIAIYHHTHPERLFIKGWITRRQASHWPIHSSALAFLSISIFTVIYFMSPLSIDLNFHRWSSEWQTYPISELWRIIAALNHAALPVAIMTLMSIWLLLNRRLKLFSITAVCYVTLWFTTILIAQYSMAAKEFDCLYISSSLIYLIAFMANLYSNTGHRNKRWLIYLGAFIAMLIFIVSLMWSNELSMSAGIISLSLGLFFSACVRVLSGTLNIKFHTPKPLAIISLALIVTVAFARVNGIS